MKKIQIIGNITSDAEVKRIDQIGKTVINFDVAVNEKYTDRQGQKVTKTSYFRCSLWREHTEIAKYMLKGVKVYVEGSPEADAYISSSENKAIGQIRINVQHIQLLTSKQEYDRMSVQQKQQRDSISPDAFQMPPGQIPPDDLPF